MAFTFGDLPEGARFSEMGHNYTKTGHTTAEREDGDEYEFDPEQDILPDDPDAIPYPEGDD